MRAISAHIVVLTIAASVAIGGSGCGSGSSGSNMSTAERRKSVEKNVAQFLVRGDRALSRGNYRRTLAMADSAEKYAPELADVHFLRGQALSRQTRYGRARKAYNRVLELDPEYRGARINLGNNAFRRRQYRQALTLYEEEEELEVTADLFVRKGLTYLNLGKVDSALTSYRRALEHDSTRASALIGISRVYEEQGELERAVDFARRAVKQDSSNADYWYTLGAQLFRAGRVEESVPLLRRVLRNRPYHRRAHYDLGQALRRTGNTAEAQKHFARADSLKERLAAIRTLKDEATNNPNQPGRWVKLGRVQMSAGRLAEATESFKIALSLAPGNIGLQANLATVYLHRGRADEAIRRYRSVLSRDSTIADVWLNLGIAHAMAGNDSQARTAWKKTLEYNPNDRAAKKYLNMQQTRSPM